MIETITTFHEQHQAALGIITGASVLMLLASVLSLPYLVSLIPADYFQYATPYRMQHQFKHPLLRLLVIIIKNILGWILIIAGLILLVLPGQGLITLALGLILINFPGKRTVECKLIGHHKVLAAINWIRARRGKEPLLSPE
jgi:uncharacterized membrane protein SpoIIM required for sporulation